MRRIVPDGPGPGEWVLNGVVYKSEAAYLERLAFDERCRAQRARLLAQVEAERGFDDAEDDES